MVWYYVKTRAEGIMMLQDYHDNPYNFENHYTFADIYRKAFDQFIADKSKSSIQAYKHTNQPLKYAKNYITLNLKKSEQSNCKE